jgi:hypothetical protein
MVQLHVPNIFWCMKNAEKPAHLSSHTRKEKCKQDTNVSAHGKTASPQRHVHSTPHCHTTARHKGNIMVQETQKKKTHSFHSDAKNVYFRAKKRTENPWNPPPPNPPNPFSFPFSSRPPISYVCLFCSSPRISYALFICHIHDMKKVL